MTENPYSHMRDSTRMKINDLGTNPDNEPAAKIGAANSTVAGILALVMFVFPGFVPDKYTNTILVIAAFTLPIITALLTRNYVWSPASVKKLIDAALKDANTTIKYQEKKLEFYRKLDDDQRNKTTEN